MNFTKAAFYKLDDGAGTAAADALGNAPSLAVIGTTTNLWANADCPTTSFNKGKHSEHKERRHFTEAATLRQAA